MENYYLPEVKRKWTCTMCTFLNAPRLHRCAQCETPKEPKNSLALPHNYGTDNLRSSSSSKSSLGTDDSSAASGAEKLHESFEPLRIADYDGGSGLNNRIIPPASPLSNPTRDSEKRVRLAASRESYPIISDRHDDDGWEFHSYDESGNPKPPPSVSYSSSSQGRGGCGSQNANSNMDKWSCSMCTYLNWPRSVKCVMCMNPRKSDGASEEDLNETKCVGGSGHSNNRSASSECSNSQILPTSLPSPLGNNRTVSVGAALGGGLGSGVKPNNRRIRELDTRWLEACRGVVDGNIGPVEEFLAAGGDPSRQLTQTEVAALDRPSAFDIGFTLVHLALRFHQEHVLAILLSQVDGGPAVVKRVPSYVAPDLALDIRRHHLASLRQRKGNLHCHYTTEIVTFNLPSEIEELPPRVLETLFDEILDRDVMKELETGQIINWSVELVQQLNSRLYALWNRSAGDCLLDSVLQATWGIFDTDNGLRRALADSLHECATTFYQRWKENELLHANHLDYSLNDTQCATDWAKLLSLASKPGSSLEQLHIFALCHILRRPIIVYGVKYVKSFRGENLGYARYEGVYLPFLWESAFCSKWPIALGYTRGHFSALVAIEPDCEAMPTNETAAQLSPEDINDRSVYLPLQTVDGTLLPIHFRSQADVGKEEMILAQWLDVRFINSGVMVACQRIQKQPLLVAQMVEEWMNHYRSLGEIASANYIRPAAATCYSSDGDTDND